jgi:hypothetical protein
MRTGMARQNLPCVECVLLPGPGHKFVAHSKVAARPELPIIGRQTVHTHAIETHPSHIIDDPIDGRLL